MALFLTTPAPTTRRPASGYRSTNSVSNPPTCKKHLRRPAQSPLSMLRHNSSVNHDLPLHLDFFIHHHPCALRMRYASTPPPLCN